MDDTPHRFPVHLIDLPHEDGEAAGLGDVSAPRAPLAPIDPVAIEISPLARLMRRIRTMPPVRHELVGRVRAEILTGTYETPDKLDIAVDRLAHDLDLR